MRNFFLLIIMSTVFLTASVFAMNGRTTYQAKIIKPDGYPLEAANVNFRFTVLDTVGSCVLYVEDYTGINMSGGGGLISFALGNGTRSFPVSGTSQTFAQVFDNSVPMFNCQTPGTYNPGPNDTRKIVMQFNDGNGWQTLPAMAINAVPYAMYANKSNDSKTLNGKADTAFVENATLAALNCNPATQAITFNGVSFSCIAISGGGGGITSVTTSGTVLTTAGTASAPVISINVASISSDGYLTSIDYAEFKAKLSASATQITNTLGYAPVSGAAVAAQISSTNLSGDVSGSLAANSVVSVGGKTAAQISSSVDAILAATASATTNTLVKRDASGNVTVNDFYANAAKVNYADIYRPSTSFNIRLQAPTSLSANYVLNLPTTSGTAGQVLSTDGSGNLSWINKQDATSAAIIATLGYTPVASSTSIGDFKKDGSVAMTGQLQAIAGNASAPAYTFNGDTNTGIYSSGADQISIATSGTDRLWIDGSGVINLGSGFMVDGYTVYSDYPFQLGGAGQSTGYTFSNGPAIYSPSVNKLVFTTGGTELTMIPSGNVGIGTSNPSAKLHLPAGTSSIAPLKLTSGTLLTSPQSGTMEYDGSYFYLTDGTNTRRAIATGSSAGTIDNASNINSSGNMTITPTGSVVVSSTTASTSSNTGALIVNGGLGVAGNINASGSIVTSGNMQAYSLDVSSTTSIGNRLWGKATFGTDYFWLGLRGTGTDGQRIGLGIEANDATTGTVKNLHFRTMDIPRMIVDSSGKVGIGTTSPSDTLHVVGAITSANTSGTAKVSITPDFADAGYVQSYSGAGVFRPLVVEGKTVTINGNGSGTALVGGNVGLGIGTPDTGWTNHIPGSTGTVLATVGGGSANVPALQVWRDTNSAFGAYFNFLKSRNGAPAANNDEIGYLNYGFLNSGSKYKIAGSLLSRIIANTDGAETGSLILRTTTSGTVADVMTMVSNNVGIGTAGPSAKLHIVDESTAMPRNLVIDNYSAGGNAAQVWGRAARGNSGAPAAVQAGDPLLNLIGGAYDGTAFNEIGHIRVIAESNQSPSVHNSFIEFTTASGTSLTEQMRITSNGNVGIGTTNPGATLDVNGNFRINNDIVLNRTSNDNSIVLSADSEAAGRKIIFQKAGGGTLSTSVDFLANVGIGTISPNGKLNIVGDWSGSYGAITVQGDKPTIRFSSTSGTIGGGNHWLIHQGNGDSTNPGSLDFYQSTDGATWGISKFKIAPTGNVGIGTNTPGTKLQIGAPFAGVSSGWSASRTMGVMIGDDSDNFYIGLENNGSNEKYATLVWGDDGTEPLLFKTNDANGVVTERARMTATGNFGVGTTTPSARVSVFGFAAAEKGLDVMAKYNCPPGDTTGSCGVTDENTGVNTLQRWGFSTHPDTWNLALKRNHQGWGNVSYDFVAKDAGTETTALSIKYNGNVGIGTTAPSEKLHVVGNLRVQGSTDCTLGNGAGGTNCSSDARLKENIKPIPYALEKINSLKGVEFDWNERSLSHGRHDIGVIAQDVEQVFPTAVMNDKNTGYKKVDYAVLVAPLIQAIKELYQLVMNHFETNDRQIASLKESKADKAEIEALKARADKLEAENQTLKSRLEAIEKSLNTK